MALLDSIKFNGKSIRDFGAEITFVSGRGKPEIKRRMLDIDGRHGILSFGAKYLPRRIDLDGYVEGASHTTLLADISNLKDLFSMHDSIEALGNEDLSDTDQIGKLEFGDETDRHYRAMYDGIFQLRDISPRWMKNDLIKFKLRFLCTDPFAYANVITEATMTPSADAFKVFDTGTFLSEVNIDIHGAVTNPVIVTGDKVGVAHFDNDDDLRDVENVNVAGNFAEAFGFRTRKSLTSQQSKGTQLVVKDLLYYDRGANVNNQNFVNFNPYQGSLIFWVKPYFDGDDNRGRQIFATDNGGDAMFLDKTSGNQLRFRFRAGSVTQATVINVTSSNFTAGKWHRIVCRWDINNVIDGSSNTVQIDLDTAEGGNTNSLNTPGGLNSNLVIGQTAARVGSSLFDGLIYYEFHERALLDSELSDLFNSGAGVEPFVTPDTKLLSAGELSGGLPVSVQYPWVDNEFTDGDQENDPSAEWFDAGATSAGFSSGANTAVTNESTIVKYDTQSAQLDWSGAASNEKAFVDTAVLVNDQDYFYRLWVFVQTLNASDQLHLDIVGASQVKTRRLDTGSDDLDVAFATGKWLYFEGTFEADGAQVHHFALRKLNANGDATVYIDQMDCQLSLIDNGGMEGTYVGGIAPGWTASGSPTGTKETTVIHSGLASQKIVSNGVDDGIAQALSGLTNSAWHLLSFWARGGAGGEIVNIAIQNFTGLIQSITSVTLTTTFTKFYVLLKTASDGSGDLKFRALSGGLTFFYDDIALIELDTVTANAASKTTPESISYSPAKYRQGLRIDGADSLFWTIVGNKKEGSIEIWFSPQFAADWADDTDDPVIVFFASDSNNFLFLSYDWTNDQFKFNKTAASSSFNALSAVQSFIKGQRIHIVATWGTSNGVQIYVDRIAGTANNDTSALASNPVTLYMRQSASEAFPDSIVDEIYVYSRELSQQEATARFNNPKATQLDNRVFGITRTYAVSDKAIIRTLEETLEFADESADTIINDISSMNSGSQFPRLPANKAVIYNKVAARLIDLNYRKRFL